MYERIKKYIKEDLLGFFFVMLSAALLLYCLLFLSPGGAERSPAYNQAREQLADAEGQRQRVEAGIEKSQSRVDSLSGRLEKTQLRVERIEDNYSSAGDIFAECEQITKELRRRAESRAASK